MMALPMIAAKFSDALCFEEMITFESYIKPMGD